MVSEPTANQIECCAMRVQAELEMTGAVEVMPWSRTPEHVKTVYRDIAKCVIEFFGEGPAVADEEMAEYADMRTNLNALIAGDARAEGAQT